MFLKIKSSSSPKMSYGNLKGTLCHIVAYNVVSTKNALHGMVDTVFAVGCHLSN